MTVNRSPIPVPQYDSRTCISFWGGGFRAATTFEDLRVNLQPAHCNLNVASGPGFRGLGHTIYIYIYI